jgi:hypothetical protein
MIPRDNEPPTIVGDVPNFTPHKITSGNSYTGTVDVAFSEPLYYLDNKETKVLDKTKCSEIVDGAYPDTTITVQKVDPDSGSLRWIRFSYVNAHEGTSITLPYSICDQATNVAGPLTLKLIKDPKDPTQLIWTAKLGT